MIRFSTGHASEREKEISYVSRKERNEKGIQEKKKKKMAWLTCVSSLSLLFPSSRFSQVSTEEKEEKKEEKQNERRETEREISLRVTLYLLFINCEVYRDL